MGKKVYGVLCFDSKSNQFCTVSDEEGLLTQEDFLACQVSSGKKVAEGFVEKLSELYPENTYTVFKMKFKETI